MNLFSTFYGGSESSSTPKKRRSVSSLTSPRNGRNPRIGTGDIYGKPSGGKPSGGNAKRGNKTQWTCNCNDDQGDMYVGAHNHRQAGRACEARGNAGGRDCSVAPLGGGGFSNFNR